MIVLSNPMEGPPLLLLLALPVPTNMISALSGSKAKAPTAREGYWSVRGDPERMGDFDLPFIAEIPVGFRIGINLGSVIVNGMQ